MKKVITQPQVCDMGDGRGEIQFEIGTRLKDVLNFYQNNSKTWGICTIQYNDGKIIRKFDFDIYNNNIFYYNLYVWELDLLVKEATFSYCFMNEDLVITIEK
jgi:hypothetical protein